MKLSEEQIKEIASELDAGFVCYIHRVTGQIRSVPHFDSHPDADMEMWTEEMDEIDMNFSAYIQIEPMDSNEAFQVMEDFADSVEDEKLQNELYRALGRQRPFSNFKFVIDGAGDCRKDWFRFKESAYNRFVKDYLGS